MRIRKSIFDSTSEALAFRSLNTRWASKLNLYPQLPLSKIFDVDEGELSDGEMRFYRSSDVDYTFCLPNGHPLLSIEFDGVGGGYSRDGSYYPLRMTDDPYRELKLQSKLHWARTCQYPLIVISFNEMERIEADDSFTIMDGVVGRLLARKDFNRRISIGSEELKNECETLPQDLKDDMIENFIWDNEVIAEMEMNLIVNKAAEYQAHCGSHSFTTGKMLAKPPLPTVKDLWDYEGVMANIEAMKRAQWVGMQVTIELPDRKIEQSAWVRNFEVEGLEAFQVAKDIAEYLGFKKAYLAVRTRT